MEVILEHQLCIVLASLSDNQENHGQEFLVGFRHVLQHVLSSCHVFWVVTQVIIDDVMAQTVPLVFGKQKRFREARQVGDDCDEDRRWVKMLGDQLIPIGLEQEAFGDDSCEQMQFHVLCVQKLL